MFERNSNEHDRLLHSHATEDTAPASSTEQAGDSTDCWDDTAAREDERSKSYSSSLVLKLGASMFDFFTTGCAMAALGIERHYETSDGKTAFVFSAGMIGYVCATASVDAISLRFGRRGVSLVTPVVRLLAALLLATEPAFGVVLAAYVCFGYGTGLTDTAWNTWASGMHRPNVFQGLLHGSFSLGCMVGPMIAVAVLQQHSWNEFYLVIALLSCVEFVTQGWAFRHDTAAPQRRAEPPMESETGVVKQQSLLRRPTIWICGAFYFVYQGVELIFTGWIVVFMLRVRHADAAVAGLASSTFWIGMAVGRYALGMVTERFGVSFSVAVYITLALCCQILLNIVSDVNTTMLLLAANGFCAAPLFPSGIVLLVSRLQTHLHMRAVALLIALGQVGGALATLAVGFMADTLGIRHLFLVMCGLSAAMLVLWILLVRVG